MKICVQSSLKLLFVGRLNMIEFSCLKPKSVLVVGGPTASGKSDLAIDLALRYNGVVLNADSMQIYKGLPILSAAPSTEDRAKVEHRLYEIFAPSQNGSVVEWLNLAVKEIHKVWDEGKMPIVVGGTGMYLDNLIKGVTPIPETKAEIRLQVSEILKQKGLPFLYQLLQQYDAETASRLSENDTTRVKRAVEVFLDTGKKLSIWHKLPMIKKLPEADFRVVKLLPETQELDERCYLRFEKMMQQGALEEVRALLGLKLDPQLPAMKMLGVPELRGYLEGKVSLEDAVSQGKLHTRQYAKRQRTWFKHKLDAEIVLSHCYLHKNEKVM